MSKIRRELLRKLHEIGIPDSLISHVNSLLVDERELDSWLCAAIDLRPKVFDETRYHAAELIYLETLSRFDLTRALAGNYGMLLVVWGRLEEAATWLQKSLQIDAHYFHALHHIGYCLELSGDYLEAEAYYSRALEVNPKSALTFNGLANVQWEKGNKSKALALYIAAIARDPLCTEAMFNIAVRYSMIGNFKGAVRYFRKLLTITPEDHLAEILCELALQNRSPPEFKSARIPLGVSLRHRKVPDIDMWPRKELWHHVVSTAETMPNSINRWPPRIFLSHRYGTGQNLEWVSSLADALKARGYEVVFDRMYGLMDEPIGVPIVLDELSKSSYFVPVITEQYRRCVEFQPGAGGAMKAIDVSVVMDEWLAALELASRKRLRVLPLWLSGPVLPLPLNPSMVVDVRSYSEFSSLLERFPKTGSLGKLIEYSYPESEAERKKFVKKSSDVTESDDYMEIQAARVLHEKVCSAIIQAVEKPH